eukprot:6973854-Alexandrium_andersonii.AAC.1
MSASLVGSEMCIRDRALIEQAARFLQLPAASRSSLHAWSQQVTGTIKGLTYAPPQQQDGLLPAR